MIRQLQDHPLRICKRLSAVSAAVAAIVLLSTAPASAAWVLVDDFETWTGTGAGGQVVDGDGGWSVIGSSSGTNSMDWRVVDDPAGGSNKALHLGGEFDLTMSKPIPGGGAIGLDGVGTMFFRFRMDGTSANPSVGVGLSDAASDGEPGVTGPWVTLNGVSGSTDANVINGVTATGGASGGGTQSGISNVISRDTWYSMWLVADHNNDTYNAYIQGGTAYPTQTLLSAGSQSELQFRQSPIGILDRVFLRPNNANSPATDIEYFDDVFVDTTGANLANPVPEPGTMLLAACGAAACLAIRRWTRNSVK